MEIANKILSLIKEDTSLTANKLSLSDNIYKVRKNKNISKLTMLVRNSETALIKVVDSIRDLSLNSENDLRVFSLLMVLFDSNKVKHSVLLSIELQSISYLPNTRLLSSNILLKDTLDV